MIKLEWMDGWNELVRWGGGLVSNRERGKDLKVSFFILFFFLNVNFSFPFFFFFFKFLSDSDLAAFNVSLLLS